MNENDCGMDQVLKSDCVKLDAENEKDERIGRRRVLTATIKEG